MTKEELLDKALHCNRCGTCRGVTQDTIPDVAFATQCPSGSTFFGCYEPSGLMYMARGLAMGNLKWNEDMAKVLYACTLCGYCDDFCQRGDAVRGGSGHRPRALELRGADPRTDPGRRDGQRADLLHVGPEWSDARCATGRER